MSEFSKKNIIGITICLFATYLLFPPYFDFQIFPIQSPNSYYISLDPSWNLCLNYIGILNLNWGKDFAFTYGPLSYLITRVSWGNERLSFLIFDLFCSLNFFLMFYISQKKSINKTFTFIFIFILVLLLPSPFDSTYPFILLSFLLFWIRCSLDKNTFIFYFFQVIIVTLLFFIKFNTGLISFVLFEVFICYKLVFKKDNTLFLLGYLIAPIFLIYMISIYLNVSILHYSSSALQIIEGYNEIMYSYNSSLLGYKKIMALIVFLCSLGILFNKINKTERSDVFKNILILFLFLVSFFVLYKQAFVRADNIHIKDFFNCGIMILFSLSDFHTGHRNKYIIWFFSLSVSLSLSFFVLSKNGLNYLGFISKIKKESYVVGFNSCTTSSCLHLFPNNNQFPQSIKERIKNSTIDSYPWNLQILLENKLNYRPRPVFQSYSAYTKVLEDKNFSFYSTNKAPEYVLFDYLSIDKRYPLFDESKLNLTFIKNYKCVDSLIVDNRKELLLQKKREHPKIKFIKKNEYILNLNSPLIPKEGCYFEVFLYRNLFGDFISIIDHGPDISLLIELKNGKEIRYRTSIKLLESGFFSSYYISNVDDFKSLINSKSKIENQIKAYYFKPNNSSLFKDKIKIIEYKITQ